jgi:dipeptidyl aminopeptidase/acylaminoacyl peptidase
MCWSPLRKSFSAALLAAAVLLFCPVFCSSAVAQNSQPGPALDRARLDEVLQGLSRGRAMAQVAVSPDGKRLAWVERVHRGAEIRVAPLDNLTKSVRVTAAATSSQYCHESEIVWSPDSAALAFISDCAHPGEQDDLYLERPDGSPAHRLTELKGEADSPAFSPDGTRIAFLYVEGATRPAGALAAMKPPAGVIGEDGIEIQRIAVAQVHASHAAAPEFATPANLHAFEFDWSPDSKSLAYVAAEPPGENNWWVAKLYTQVLKGAPHALLAPAEVLGALHGLQIAVPRWSPDGKAIAFIGGLMSDQGSTGGDVWIISAAGGEPRNLTPQRPSSPSWMEWNGNSQLFITELAGGNGQFVRLDLDGSLADGNLSARAGKPVFSFPGAIGDGRMELSLSATADRSLFVFSASNADHPTEVYAARPAATPAVAPAGDFAGLARLTHFNDGVQPAWGKSVSLDWTSDSFHVQGWLMLPKDYDPAKKYPLIVEVHGGPSSAAISRWGASGSLSPAAFSALGYFVLQPNPRGSFGQGEAFTQANRRDFGYGDLRDILAGVDTVLAKYPVDPNRVGITGWSYGGFMTMFAVTQTHRFRAAVSGAGISNWLSYYGENAIGQWLVPFFGASVYDDPAVYARSSAINFIKQAATPTLVVVGDRDGECPAPQSFEFWHALRDRHVPTQLVVYPDEGHGFIDPAHRRDVLERALNWFARYMPPAS